MPHYSVELKLARTQKVRVVEAAHLAVEAEDEDGAIEAAARMASEEPGRVFFGDDESEEIIESTAEGEPWVAGIEAEDEVAESAAPPSRGTRSPLELRVPIGGGMRVAIFLDCDPECGMPLIGALGGRVVYGRAEYEEQSTVAPPPGLRVYGGG